MLETSILYVHKNFDYISYCNVKDISLIVYLICSLLILGPTLNTESKFLRRFLSTAQGKSKLGNTFFALFSVQCCRTSNIVISHIFQEFLEITAFSGLSHFSQFYL
jgi:hypothetical protein